MGIGISLKMPGAWYQTNYDCNWKHSRTSQDLAQTLINTINPNAKIVSDDIRLRPEKSEVERLLGSAEKIKVKLLK